MIIDQNTNFFQITDNFAKTAHIPSIHIFESKIDFAPKVTIAIPTYKRAELLKEALDSAINQIGYSEYDIIVVDNNPERCCETEIMMLSYQNPKLSYYKNTDNLGMAGNWNRCFELSKGEYVVMLHDDDLLLPSFIAKCIKILEFKQNTAILKPLAINWISDIQEISLTEFSYKDSNKIQRLYDISNFSTYWLGPPSGCVFRRKNVFDLGGFNQDFYPYMDFCYTVICCQKYPVFLYHNRLSVYRIMANDSLNLSTLLSSFEGVYFLRRKILRKYKIPNRIIDYYLGYNLSASINNYKNLNSEFKYDIKDLGLRVPTKFESIIYFNIVRVLNILVYLFTAKKVKKGILMI